MHPGGWVPAYLLPPWSYRQRPKLLDMSLRADAREEIFKTAVTTDMEAALPTGHVPLRCTIARRASRVATTGAQGSNDLHKYSKQARRRLARQRRQGWREVHPGQFASLIPTGAWTKPELLQNAVRWVARAAAPQGRLRLPTPFDDMETTIALEVVVLCTLMAAPMAI